MKSRLGVLKTERQEFYDQSEYKLKAVRNDQRAGSLEHFLGWRMIIERYEMYILLLVPPRRFYSRYLALLELDVSIQAGVHLQSIIRY